MTVCLDKRLPINTHISIRLDQHELMLLSFLAQASQATYSGRLLESQSPSGGLVLFGLGAAYVGFHQK